jgi:AraC-like DNA-binding protein
MRRWQIIRSTSAPRHIHQAAYASVVLTGGYEEAGDLGRFFLSPGDVIFHQKFESHLNRFCPTGVMVLNLRLVERDFARPGLYRVDDLDRLVRKAERDSREASEYLHNQVLMKYQRPKDWPDELATAVRRNPDLRFTAWAGSHGIRPWELTRGFQQVFDIAPEKFRARARTMLALERIRETRESLISISASMGFSDQSHMCRSVRALTGTTPGAWRLHESAGIRTGSPY